MVYISETIMHVFIFLSVYVQIFFLITLLENHKKIIRREGKINLKEYPAVTIVVPIFNEEHTVQNTVNSLLSLNYPQDKLNIFLINDGSTDGTSRVIDEFSKYSNVRIFHKENGGKFTALNLGLEESQTQFFGCLDADSFAHSESLVRLMSYFEKDTSLMAVVPSVTVHNSKNFIQNAQVAEYYMGVYFKKMLGFLRAIDVTPGPMTIFKKQVFNELGGYRHGHNTEDMEIAYRMQRHSYKIEHCNDAYVYTNTPSTLKKLYKQRLRWIFGFLNNTIDYRDVLFRKKYGNFGFFTFKSCFINTFNCHGVFSAP
jgi:cellulose synthase/poly-beta-1,6-N-acetylglucosamine synthase-like glycosyltransferase